MEPVHHFPPEVLQVLTQAVGYLNRSKPNVLDFFRGAGVPAAMLAPLDNQIRRDRHAISKFEIARQLLVQLNDLGDTGLGPRREVVRRIVEFDSFEGCWPDDRLKAKGLVSEVRDLVGTKDAFTRMSLERDKALAEHRATKVAELEQRGLRRRQLDEVKRDFYALFGERDAKKRGKALEAVLNRLFHLHKVLIREAFELRDPEGNGTFEQIDGVIQFDGQLYLVEMKWKATPIGPGELGQHMVRVMSRGGCRGMFISNSTFTPAGLEMARDQLQRAPSVLAELQEFVVLLEDEGHLQDMLRRKVTAAVVDRTPLLHYDATCRDRRPA